MSDELRRSYDSIPYESHPFPQTHPDRLATIGTLLGMTPAPPAGCRVLEIGCASGGNLVSMAETLPNATLVGIDFSGAQIARGNAMIGALRLGNVSLREMDLRALDRSLGDFDYIIAHGVMSWVPTEVQQKLLAVCAQHLRPHGIAYVSYNVLPGWTRRAIAREAMQYHTRHVSDPAARIHRARGVLEFLAAHARDDDGHATMLRAEAGEARAREDYYIFHEHLEAVNEAFHFHEFIARASDAGLRYLAEAAFATMFADDLPAAAQGALAALAPDLVSREQLLDFLRNRSFRQTLLVRSDVELERRISPLRVQSLLAASRASPAEGVPRRGDAVEFRTIEGDRVAVADEACTTAFSALADMWPHAAAFDELCSAVGQRLGRPVAPGERTAVASALLKGFASGAIELHSVPDAFTLEPGARPLASSLTRYQASTGPLVTTLRHEELRVDPATREILRHLDGERTRDELAAVLWPDFDVARGRALLDEALPQLARQALIAR